MKLEMTKMAVALAFTLSVTGVQAAVVGPTDMRITGGAYGLGAFTGGVAPLLTSSYWNGSFGPNDITDQYNPPGWNTVVPQTLGILAPGASLGLAYGTGPTDQMNGFFAPSLAGVTGGGAAPVFNGLLVNGNVSSIDMNSFFVNWNGNTWNQGNTFFQTDNATSISLIRGGAKANVTNLAMSSCVPGVSCNWTMSWISVVVGGPLNGVHGTWALSGTIAAVPEASTYGMMLSGLGLVGLAARRRRK